MAEVAAPHVHLEEEIEGERSGTDDFVFCRIGDSVPLKPCDSAFDLKSPPSRPLAVSERHRALFIAHSEGFMLARTKDVIGLANEIKEKGKGPCVQGSSVVDVKIGRVSILALSKDSSLLAATVGGDIFVYSVSSLLGKNQEPIFSCSLNKSGIVKDLKWQKNVEKSFVVISSDGLLYHGQFEGHLKDIMDDVDAVDWSVEGDSIAVAKRNTLSILSSDFKERLSMSLLFQSWPGDADSESVIKVDSVEWVRDDSIIVGCVRADKVGNEEGYLVQVITSREHKFIEGACKPTVFSFPDLFEGISDNVLPGGCGPYLLLSYLDHWELVLASNKKNIEGHVLLLKWSAGDGAREVLSLEFQSDKYTPRIDLQENLDDNFLLGFAVDKISVYEKVEIKVDNEHKELSPHCVLLCLTCEGKLIMYHAARVSEPSELPQSSIPTLDDYNAEYETLSTQISTENQLLETTFRAKNHQDGLIPNDRFKLTGTQEPAKHIGKELENVGNKETSKVPGNNIFADKQEQSTGGSLFGLPTGQVAEISQIPLVPPLTEGPGSALRNNIKPGMQQHKFTPIESGFRATSLVETTTSRQDNTKNIIQRGELGKDNTKNFKQSDEWGKGFLGSSGSMGTSCGSQSTGKLFASDAFKVKPSAIASGGSVLSDTREKPEVSMGNKLLLSPHNRLLSDLSGGKACNSDGSGREPSPFLFSSDKGTQRDGQTTLWTKTVNAETVPAIRGSPPAPKGSVEGKSLHFKAHPFVDNTKNLRSPQMLDSETELSKQFYNVKDMAKELDTLLSFIEQEGGFRDACTRFQQSSLLALEEGLQNLSEISRMRKSKIEEQLMEVQELQNKMSQVSARQVYMESIVRQASDRQYWDIWNRQKLSPEFELKRQHILNADQNLTNQLIELERHFNSLEINRFGESSRLPVGRRTFHNNSGLSRTSVWSIPALKTIKSAPASAGFVSPFRQNVSLHSVCSTLKSQLAAAQQLSECLSKQMAMLNIKSPTVKRGSVAKELFESIGLAHGADAFQSPDVKKSGLTLDSVKRFSPSTATAGKEYPRRSLSSALKSVEPETARRRRDSLDRRWASFEPQKTTVKRISQEECSKLSADTPFRIAKEAFDSQMASIAVVKRRDDETPASSLPRTSISKFLSHESSMIGGFQDRPSRQALESESGCVFQWAKGFSASSRTPESNQSPMQDVQKSIKPPTLMTSSVSVFNSTQSSTNNVASFGVNRIGGPSNLVPRMISTVQQEASTPTLTSSISAVPSADNIAQIENNIARKDRSTESVSVHSSPQSKTSPSTLSLSVPSSTPTTSSSVSASITPSLQPSSLPAMAFGGSLNAKAIGETNATSSASPLISVASLLSSTGSSPQSLKSPVSTSFPSTSENVVSHSPALRPASPQAPANEVSVQLNKDSSKPEPDISQPAATGGLVGLASIRKRDLLPASSGSTFPAASDSQCETRSAIPPPSNTTASEENEELDASLSQEDEMEEEAPDTTNVLNLGALGGFGLGSTPPSSAPKSNPFGGSFITAVTSSPLSFTSSPGELFRPASFSLSSAQPIQPSQSMISGAFSGSASGFSGLGQPAQVGAGQQALGSVLGAFGQSRQLGAGVQGFGFASSAAHSTGGFASAGGFSGSATGGGFAFLASKGGGFAAAATGGSFAAVASSGGGFGGAATGGGFAAVAPSSGGFAGGATGGGFAAVASGSGGFAGAPSVGGGFGGSGQGGGHTAGGFGAFSSNPGGFSAFGGNSAAGAGRPPENLFTQMRK